MYIVEKQMKRKWSNEANEITKAMTMMAMILMKVT